MTETDSKLPVLEVEAGGAIKKCDNGELPIIYSLEPSSTFRFPP